MTLGARVGVHCKWGNPWSIRGRVIDITARGHLVVLIDKLNTVMFLPPIEVIPESEIPPWKRPK